MLSWPLHGSGMSMLTASSIGLPASTSSSSTLSKVAESLPPSRTTGLILSRSGPYTGCASMLSRACIQLMLPRTVLISPLCAMKRKGWARSQVGNVLVLYRWCTRAIALVIFGSERSG